MSPKPSTTRSNPIATLPALDRFISAAVSAIPSIASGASTRPRRAL